MQMNRFSCFKISIVFGSLFLFVVGTSNAYQSRQNNSCTLCQNSMVMPDNEESIVVYSKNIQLTRANRLLRSSKGDLPCCSKTYCQHMIGHCGVCFVAACVDTTTVLITPPVFYATRNRYIEPLPVYISPPIRPPQPV